jgi:hypothetical protein
MSRPRWKKLWRPLARRLCAGAALLAYLATAVGFSLPVFPAKDLSQPFPCQDHACGCRSAEECWRHCCCFSPDERQAWARAHHVEPPAYAEPAVARGWNSPRLRDQAAGKEHSTTRCASCPEHRAEPTAGRCCSAPSPARTCCHETTSPAAKPAPSDGPAGPRWVSGLAALKCRGLSTLWVSSGAVLPPPALLSWAPVWPPAGSLAYHDAAPLPVLSCPPEPPPRLPCA